MALPAGILDTCVAIELGAGSIDEAMLPDEQAITSITLGELSAGPLIAQDIAERSRRQLRLQVIETQFVSAILPYDAAAARLFGRVVSSAMQHGRTSRVRTSDYQIAAIAIANALPLYTMNVKDFVGIDDLVLLAVDVRAT